MASLLAHASGVASAALHLPFVLRIREFAFDGRKGIDRMINRIEEQNNRGYILYSDILPGLPLLNLL